ncbi:MAG: carboxynorspermidine decarboxylase [Lachnospiraceae bacterium]|nr:carboxynorspermidine decarboxylase [Lachnospiraceae bacterium]
MNRIENRPSFCLLNGKLPQEIFSVLPTPCYIIEEAGLQKNGEILSSIIRNTGCKILLAQKAFSNYDFYPLLSDYLSGTEASGLFEARLGAEKMPKKEVHVFCAAYREKEFDELLTYADHIVFNSPGQLKRFGPKAKEIGKSIGLRINPQCSTQEGHAIYDPCAPTSRLGTTREIWDMQMTEELVELLDGLHFHTLCEQDADALQLTLHAVEEQFADILPRMKWLNMGGGHHITREGYDIPLLEKLIIGVQNQWNVEVYLEPGEAVALNAGYLAARVLDIVQNHDTKIAILDVSAACHMPDVIEMPYTPPLYGEISEKEGAYSYILAGPTCLAGDVIGRYCFEQPLQIGDMILFGDMAIYSTCKNNTFNGMSLPNIWKRGTDGKLEQLTDFGYQDFSMRLGRRKSDISKKN